MKKFIQSITSLFIIISSFSCTNFLSNQNNNEWLKDKNFHWHLDLSGEIGEIKNKEKHSFDNWILSEIPTTQSNGSKYRKCKVCGYLDIFKINKIPDYYIDKMIIPNHSIKFEDSYDLEIFIENVFNKSNKYSFYYIDYMKYTRSLPREFSIYYESCDEGIFINPVIKQSFYVNEKALEPLNNSDNLDDRYSLIYDCIFYPFIDKDIDLDDLQVLFISKNKIQIKCPSFFLINVEINDINNFNFVVNYIKEGIKRSR